MIIFGAAHKYYIDDYLKGRVGLEVLTNMADWFNPETADEIAFDENINAAAINNLKASKELLKTRLESNFYSPDYGKRMEGKYRAIDRAIENFQKLSQKN